MKLDTDNLPDLPVMPKAPDLSTVKTPKKAARLVYEYVQGLNAASGGHDSEVQLFAPDECPRGWGGWHVMWEGGPFEWAIWLGGGSSWMAGELGGGSKPGPFPHGINGPWGHAEAGYSFSLVFHGV